MDAVHCIDPCTLISQVFSSQRLTELKSTYSRLLWSVMLVRVWLMLVHQRACAGSANTVSKSKM